MRNTSSGKPPSMERQDTEPCLDQNTFNYMLNSSPSTENMLDAYNTGTFFEAVSGMPNVVPSAQMTIEPQPQQVAQPRGSVSASQLTSAMVSAALRRVNGNGSRSTTQGAGLGLPAFVNFTNSVPSTLPHIAIQGREDEYNNQYGAGMYPVVRQDQHQQPNHPQRPPTQLTSQMQSFQFGGYYEPVLPSAAPNTLMPCAPQQNSVLQYQSSDMQMKSGYQGDAMSTPNIGALSSLPSGVMQVQKQVQIAPSDVVPETMYAKNTQQQLVTFAPCESRVATNPSCSTSSHSIALQVSPPSPDTEEASLTVEEMYGENHDASFSQIGDLPELPDLSDTDFSTEPKFVPNQASSKKEVYVSTDSLSRADSIDVSQIVDWRGQHNFTIGFPTDARKNRKWGYCGESKRVFCQPNIAVEVQVRVDDWAALEGADARVRLCPVYLEAHYRTTPVTRCDHHKLQERMKDKEAVEIDYLIQIDQRNAEYGKVGRRQIVSAPLQPSHIGEKYATLLVKCSCMTSCVGGPNRRPFAVIFSLMVNGTEAGRRIMGIKCCKGVSRDMKAEKSRLLAAESPAADPTPPPQQPPTNNTHTITINLDSKKRRVERNAPSSSDNEPSPGKKRRATTRAVTLPDSVPQAPSGYCYMLLPVEYKQRVTDYLTALRAQAYLRERHPDAFKRLNN